MVSIFAMFDYSLEELAEQNMLVNKSVILNAFAFKEQNIKLHKAWTEKATIFPW